MKLSPKWVIGIVAGLYFLVFSGRGWTPSPLGFGLFLAAVAIAVKISRKRAAKRAHEARIVATGHRAELAVEEIVPGGAQIKMNGQVTRQKVDVKLERGIVPPEPPAPRPATSRSTEELAKQIGLGG
jgi:hypothetical protein